MSKFSLEQMQNARDILVNYGFSTALTRLDADIEKAKRPQAELDFLERFAAFLNEAQYNVLTPDEIAEITLGHLKGVYDFLGLGQVKPVETIKESYTYLVADNAPELLLFKDNEGDYWFRLDDRTFWCSGGYNGLFTYFEEDRTFAPYTPAGWLPDGTRFYDNRLDKERTVKSNAGFDSMYIE